MSQDERSLSTDGPVGNDEYGGGGAEVVEFYLGEECFAIDIDIVDGIVEMNHITRVPRAPDAVEGVMDLRGETTAVVDPTAFLSIGASDGSENILVLSLAGNNQKIGIWVDEVSEVRSYRESLVDYKRDLDGLSSTAIEDELLKGIIRKPIGEIDDEGNSSDGRLVLWLDIERLVWMIDDTLDSEESKSAPDTDIQA